MEVDVKAFSYWEYSDMLLGSSLLITLTQLDKISNASVTIAS